MTLDEFIAKFLPFVAVYRYSRAHVHEPDFQTLYVRLGSRIIHNAVERPVLDIATVAVVEDRQNQGVFRGLLDRIRRDYPTLHIYIENASGEHFQAFLARYGFTIIDPQSPTPCYFLQAKCRDAG